MSRSLTDSQLRDLETVERTFSCLSLAGTSFILFTFLYSPVFRRPVNRLIFYASWGNTLCNVATLMSQSGVRAGRDSHLCQFQGFLIQMYTLPQCKQLPVADRTDRFLPADALWNLAMAINVYMTLFYHYNAQQLKRLEWRYHLMCYGLPLVVGLVYLFVETPARGKMYGPATVRHSSISYSVLVLDPRGLKLDSGKISSRDPHESCILGGSKLGNSEF